jgi:hypothetical protein
VVDSRSGSSQTLGGEQQRGLGGVNLLRYWLVSGRGWVLGPESKTVQGRAINFETQME